jgi:twinkle protein
VQTFADVGIDTRGRTGSFKMQCPRCGGKTDLSVDTEKKAYQCHKAKCDFKGYLKDDPRPVQWQKKDYFKPEFENKGLNDKAEEFFKHRCIPLEIVANNQITVERGALAFPYIYEGEVVMVKYRAPNKKFWTTKNPKKVFYNAHKITKDTDMVAICEGEIDCLALQSVGVSSVSVPNGAPAVNATSFSDLDESFRNSGEAFDGISKIILATDSDAPGRKLEEELARRFGKERCWRVVWPDGCKDANAVLMEHGEDMLIECIDNAQPYPVDGIYNVMGFRDKLMNLYEHGLPTSYSTGSFALDHYYTVMPGELTVVTGIPGHGKSSFVEWLMINLIKEQKFRFGLFTPEHEPVESHIARLAELIDGRPFSKDQPAHLRMSQDGIDKAVDLLEEHCHYVIPDALNRKVDDILGLAKVLVAREGIKGLIVDPWNEISMEEMGTSETHFIREALGKFRRFARSHQVAIWIVAHPAKQYKDKSTGEYKAPNLYDISGSSRWRDMCDNGICIFRKAENEGDDRHSVEIHIGKIKHKYVGQIGKVDMRYDYDSGRFTDQLHAVAGE